jgi:hypothetical protein
MSYLARLPGKCGRSLLAAALALGTLAPAAAAPGSTTTWWRCWYNGDTRVQCVLKEAADPAVAPSPYADVNLPGVVKTLWAQPAQLADKRVFVPLFNEPEDWDRVRLLTEAVVCGRQRADCAVEFSRTWAEAVLLDPSLEDF